ncbi:MAG: sigma 54-interacting transcriptional regulator [Enterococcus lacertideformus]|uniref:Sigma 54-interacting transcriptional regulator n=1 Tax=Enterococcus lacertideformus TaxID=2771493 RepID=A0A931AX10_9ENTE|nr:sigma 54-interacting transcriptional regulator [Enterococcus lacertideformus]
MLKEEIQHYLENQTAFIDLTQLSEVFTATSLAKYFKVKRNTVSHYLNQLNEEGILVKINSRPVYYFHKIAFEHQFFSLTKIYYSSTKEIIDEQPIFARSKDLFSLVIGHEASLKEGIEQIKTALFYPDGGLPVLITGESGTGKSFLVNIVYQYCIEYDLLPENAPFVTLNCAQYADNPELLTSNLFGHVHGAYTGATQDKMGAFEAADGGMLFLDEVHRLSPEGQEKLFTYLDQGIIYRMGDTNNARKVDVRLFFATTEEVTNYFLPTFIRRIPFKIDLPSLKARSKEERLELIYSFFLNEQKKINRPMKVSGQVLTLLTNQNFSGNIGELKNSVKVAVAKAFAEQPREKNLAIKLQHLQKYLLKVPHHNSPSQAAVWITDKKELSQLMEKRQPEQERMIRCFESLLLTFKKSSSILSDCEEKLKEEVIYLFDYLLFETSRQEKHELLVYWMHSIRETLKQMESAYQIKFDGNSVYALSYYLYQRSTVKWLPEEGAIEQLMKELDRQLEIMYPANYHYAHRILELTQAKLDLEITLLDNILLTIYLRRTKWSKEQSVPKAIIAAHGYATASSMANVANRLLGKDLFESFDMPLDVTPQQIADEIIDYSNHHDVSNGLIILVDMGSLKEIYQLFKDKVFAPIVILNNVTTPLAISIGEKMQKITNLEEIVQEALATMTAEWKIIYPKKSKQKALLITCMTGIGTAVHMSELLEKSLPANGLLKIIPYEYQVLQQKKLSEPVFSMLDVIGIIGTTNPKIEEIPYLSLESLISGEKMDQLVQWLTPIFSKSEKEAFDQQFIRNFSLEKVLESVTILDTEKVMTEIELFMRELEIRLDKVINTPQKIALFVHVSCLIERLIRQIPIESYHGHETLLKCQKETLNWIKESFSVIEEHYSVNIPPSEVAYIYDILVNVDDKIGKEEEF